MQTYRLDNSKTMKVNSWCGEYFPNKIKEVKTKERKTSLARRWRSNDVFIEIKLMIYVPPNVWQYSSFQIEPLPSPLPLRTFL